MRRLLRRRPALGMAILSSVATLIGIVVVLEIDWFPTQASSGADDIDTLYDVLLIASVPIFVGVMSVALYSVFAFRAKPGDLSDGAPIHGNTKLEVIWVTIPFIMVTALAIYGWVVLDDIEAKQPNTLTVDVTGQQFAWSFAYPGEKVKSNQLVLPKGRPVNFRIHTKDVLHDFWVPEFRLKSDAVPGLTTHVRTTPTRLGRYDVVCAELCGIGHATMRQAVRVVPPREYDKWIADRKSTAKDGGVAKAGGDAAAAGKQLFTDSGCNACHTLSDAGSTAKIGPELNDIAAQAAKYGKAQKQTAAEYVKTSIEDPGAFTVPNFGKNVMPRDYKKQLSPEEIDTLVKYLLSVGGGKK
jgi:cytochrome c oxidase subunit II